MTAAKSVPVTVGALDTHTRELVELAIAIATFREEAALRAALSRTLAANVNPAWVEELILQSYLFVGFPRALNAAREWRRASRRSPPPSDTDADPRNMPNWEARGEATCATVYGDMYERLRRSIRELHPALDAWMIVDGYGKVLSRPALDLWRRELCIVAVCGVDEQDRQLHAHLHGALNAGATPDAVDTVLDLVAPHVTNDARLRFRLLWARVRKS